ncbi:unnamed protein product [Mytilus edulis]|uniref:Uncharacterized protein n=1 Tax=Mytilus edulis TaxID=6550 RepID=A0A8S3R9D6_MYTED|nr:unnamed protein product [Mytilus edulis]
MLSFFEEKADDFRKMDDGEVIWDTENNPVVTERKRLCQIEQELRTRQNIIDEVIDKLKPDSVFSIVENISREIPEESALNIQPPNLIYIEGKERLTTEVLGSVIKIPEVVLIQTFEVNSFIIGGLVSLNDDICVMHSKSAQKFKYFTISGSKFVTVKDITDNTFVFNKKPNMTNYKGEIVLSNMRLIKDSGILANLSLSFTSDKLNFHGIHSDNYYTFTVGFTHEILSKDRHKTESAGILELEINHRNEICKKRRIEWNSSEFGTLFTLPEKITTSINGYIYVIDHVNSKRGRVVAIEKWGQPKWAYNGHPSINSGNDFPQMTLSQHLLVWFW